VVCRNKGTNINVKQLLLAIFIVSVSVMGQCIPVHAEDAVVSFTNARNAFDAGEYRKAASRFEAMIEKGLDNEALLMETHKYLGVCYIFLADEKNAEDQFLKLLNLDPNFKLDPLVFPIDVVDFFTAVQRKHALELKEIAEAEARAEEARKKAEEKRRLEEIEQLRTTVYLERHVKWHSRLVAVMPFGAGQFQNGHKRKGMIFLTGELALLGACITTYALHASLRNESRTPFYNPDTRKKYERLEIGYRSANLISVGTLGLVALLGILDSLHYFKPTTVHWKKIKEDDVPENLRTGKRKPRAALSPFFTGHGAGLGAVGTF
jgi:tetratricopeptide (TPR) repeat protein